MNDESKSIILKFRDYLFTEDLISISLDEFSKRTNIPMEEIRKNFATEEELVESVLEFERNGFEEIFVEYDFEGVNAIDILLTVSRELAKKFKDISPSVTYELKKYYPEIYHKHFESRRNFIYGKVKINLTKGINQGIYRDDLSIELIARLYLSRLIDLHNPDFFPKEEFSFETLFNVMFENFIRGIVKPEGLEYFEKTRKKYRI